ncbi:MAG: thioredoxin family protein [Candidatus Obscuribacterales bacterium]|nr:thioredoxin family protein [Candidatus Obscuribacterales bacterium]
MHQKYYKPFSLFQIFFCFSLVCLLLLGASPIQAQNYAPDTAKKELMDAVTRGGPVVIRFYDSSAGCENHLQAFESARNAYRGKVTFISFDISKDRQFAEDLRVTVCPSFLFIQHSSKTEQLSKRHWGALNLEQFDELIKEYFNITN